MSVMSVFQIDRKTIPVFGFIQQCHEQGKWILETHSNSSHILESEEKSQWRCQSPFSKPMSLLINIKNGIFYAKIYSEVERIQNDKYFQTRNLTFLRPEFLRSEIFEIGFFLKLEIFKPCFVSQNPWIRIIQFYSRIQNSRKKPLCNRHKIRIKIRTDILYRYSPN